MIESLVRYVARIWADETAKHQTLEINDANGDWIVRAIKKRNHRKGIAS